MTQCNVASKPCDFYTQLLWEFDKLSKYLHLWLHTAYTATKCFGFIEYLQRMAYSLVSIAQWFFPVFNGIKFDMRARCFWACYLYILWICYAHIFHGIVFVIFDRSWNNSGLLVTDEMRILKNRRGRGH